MKKSMLVLLLLGLVHSGYAMANLQSDHDRAILKSSEADTSLTKKEKLFRYRCQTIKKYLGFDDTATGKAIKHSCDKPEIGIALYAGDDLGEHSPEKVAEYFERELTKNNISAKVFIKHKHPYGTSMGFYINGSSWLRDPVNPLKGIELIEALAAEALLILYTEKRIKEWPKGAKTPSSKKATQSR